MSVKNLLDKVTILSYNCIKHSFQFIFKIMHSYNVPHCKINLICSGWMVSSVIASQGVHLVFSSSVNNIMMSIWYNQMELLFIKHPLSSLPCLNHSIKQNSAVFSETECGKKSRCPGGILKFLTSNSFFLSISFP